MLNVKALVVVKSSPSFQALLPGVKLRVERPAAPLTHPGCVPWVVLTHPVTRDQYCVRSQGAGGTPTNKLTCTSASFNTTAAGSYL